MMIKERQKYDRDFKQKAVELSFARGSAKEIAEELGGQVGWFFQINFLIYFSR
jgi:transposase-like protein